MFSRVSSAAVNLRSVRALVDLRSAPQWSPLRFLPRAPVRSWASAALVTRQTESHAARIGGGVRTRLLSTETSELQNGTYPTINSVVKVYSVVVSPNYFMPWQKKPQRECTGSGFVIEGRKILTNAHIVADQSFVMIRKHGSPTKYNAQVVSVSHDCDVALLSVPDEDFWCDVHPLELADSLPDLQQVVSVVGYPTGGDNACVTSGVVSRVEQQQYAHGACLLLAIQIDAAINPGNSGGPAMIDNKVVGIAFQSLVSGENIGYIIPVPIVNHFLTSVARDVSKHMRFCSLGITCQSLENPYLRNFFKMPPGMTGVLVNKIQSQSSSSSFLQKNDVLLQFDDEPVANDGTVHFRNRERVSLNVLISLKHPKESCKLKIMRDGKVIIGEVPIEVLNPLVPVNQYDQMPSYYIRSGLVFVPLVQPYLHEFGGDWYNQSPRRLCSLALEKDMEYPDQQIVALSQILISQCNVGYESFTDHQVHEFNGVKLKNLKHLVELIETNAEPYLRFMLDDNRTIVLEKEASEREHAAILERYCIHKDRSLDLR